MSRFVRGRWLAVWTPGASAAAYYGWLAIDSGSFQPCGALSLTYGFVPLFVLPVAIVAVKTRVEGRSWPTAAVLTGLSALATAALLVFVWLLWFGKNHCGD